VIAYLDDADRDANRDIIAAREPNSLFTNGTGRR
jgi:hypothetical protein